MHSASSFLCKKSMLIFLFILLFGTTFPIIAQSKLGFNIGRSYSKFISSNNAGIVLYDFSEKFDHKGFLFNINYNYQINKYISLRPSIGYAKRGTNLQTNIGIIGYNKFSLNYLNTSLLIGISPFKFISINGGINIGYLIKATDYASRSY